MVKGFLSFAIGFALIVGVSGLALWGAVSYVDDRFGSGVAALVFFLLLGLIASQIINAIVRHQTNETHRLAGEDITTFAREMGKAQVESWRLAREVERGNTKRIEGDQRVRIIDHKSATARDDFLWRQEQKRAAEESAAADDRLWYTDQSYDGDSDYGDEVIQ